MEKKTKIMLGVGLLAAAAYLHWKSKQPKTSTFLNATGNAALVSNHPTVLFLANIPSKYVPAKKMFGITTRKASGGTAKITYVGSGSCSSNITNGITFDLSSLNQLQARLNALGFGNFKVQNLGGGQVMISTDGCVNTIIYYINGSKSAMFSQQSTGTIGTSTLAAMPFFTSAMAQPIQGQGGQSVATQATALPGQGGQSGVASALTAQIQPAYAPIWH